MVAPVDAGARSLSSFYWREDAGIVRKICVVAREVFLSLAAVIFFGAYPTVFTACMLGGLVFHDSLNKGFDHLLRLYNKDWVTSIALSIIMTIGAIYSFPVSMCIMGLWVGHRIAALSEHTTLAMAAPAA